MLWAKKKQITFDEDLDVQEVDKPSCNIADGFNHAMYHKLNSKYYHFMNEFKTTSTDATIISLFGDNDLAGMYELNVNLVDATDSYKTGSVLDTRLGVTTKDAMCRTCCQTMLTCQGHMGYIKLNVHFVHPSYLLTVNKLLRAICNSCGELLMKNESDLEMLESFDARLTLAEKEGIKHPQCKGCSFVNPIIKNPPYHFDHDDVTDLLTFLRPRVKRDKSDMARFMKIKEIEDFLNKIKYDAITLLYGEGSVGKPINMLTKFIVVSPAYTRPTSMGVEDDSQLTEMYDLIMATNKDIFGGPEVMSDNMSDVDVSTANHLYKLFMKMIDRDVVYVRTLSLFRNLKSLISKKSGLIRGNAIGKRINYSSRTVLSPAAEASVGEMSYPSEAAKTMTVTEPVTGYNIDRLREEWSKSYRNQIKRIFSVRIQQTGHQLFGQTVMWKPNSEYYPHIGDIVNRTIRTGDMVVFDRQPTLDQYSLLGSQVILPKRNMRVNGINSSHTKPANADFDGDEGNVYVLQSLGSQCEARMLTNIRSSIISSATSAPIISIQYHGIVGLYKLTLNDVLLDDEDWETTFNMFWSGRAVFIPIYLHGKEEISDKMRSPTKFAERLKKSGIPSKSGRAILSSILPPGLNYERDDVKIKDGILLSGPFTKKDIGGSDKGLIAVIDDQYGAEAAADFLSSAQKMADWYLTLDPVSIGLTHINPINRQNKRLEGMLEDDNIIDSSLSSITKEKYVKMIWKAPDSASKDINDWVAINKDKIGELGEFKHSVEFIVSGAAEDIQRQVDHLPFRSDMTETEILEREASILSIAAQTNKIGRDLAKDVLGDDNPVVQLYKSGAKGSEGNIAQMAGSIGQTTSYGKRPIYYLGKTLEYPEGTKTLPFFRGKDSGSFKETIQSRGYVNSSYVVGTTPSQFIFSMAQERIGVITSRVSTASSGFFARQIMKFLEERHIGSSGDIVDTSGRYISFGGFDGLDGTKVKRVFTKKYGSFYAPFSPKNIISRLANKV